VSQEHQSRRLGRKTIEELPDGTLAIHFHDDHCMVMVRFIRTLGIRSPQVALVDDVDDLMAAEHAQIITGRNPRSKARSPRP
jgi:hypothetical protein